MERIWLKSYPEGVPDDINPDSFTSLVEIFKQAVEKHAHLPAFENMGTVLSFQQINVQAHTFAAYLQNRLGVVKGTRVALMLPNLLQYPIAMFGTLLAGGIAVNVNPLYTARELEHQLNDAGAEVIVVFANVASVLAQVIKNTSVRHVIVTDVGDVFPWLKRHIVNFVVRHIKKLVPAFELPQAISWHEVMSKGQQLAFNPVILSNNDIAYLQYTGGTTGISKGAVLTHRNMVANILQVQAWIGKKVQGGQEVVITALPLYHVFCLLANCLLFFSLGALNILITNPRDMKGFVKILRRLPRFTAMTGVNTLFNGLLNTPGFKELDFRHFHFALGGGTAVQEAVAEKWKKITGTTLLEAYGMTETSPAVSINPLDLSNYNGSIGLPISSTLISIRDDEGNELPINEIGELCVKGPQVIQEYWQKPEETQASFYNDGFLRTGDMGLIDERGYLFLKERKKDMIIISGFNVYPTEVEDVLAHHPGIFEAAVVGVASAETGEAVKAFIVRRDPKLTAEDVIQYCRSQLTAYKVPKQIEFRDSLPKSNVGKILRRELRK